MPAMRKRVGSQVQRQVGSAGRRPARFGRWWLTGANGQFSAHLYRARRALNRGVAVQSESLHQHAHELANRTISDVSQSPLDSPEALVFAVSELQVPGLDCRAGKAAHAPLIRIGSLLEKRADRILPVMPSPRSTAQCRPGEARRALPIRQTGGCGCCPCECLSLVRHLAVWPTCIPTARHTPAPLLSEPCR